MKEPDSGFYKTLATDSKAMGINPEWFLRILYEESALNPASDNGSFVGLSQLSKKYLTDRRIDPNDYATWEASRQWSSVVGPWFVTVLRGRVPPSIGALYAYNLAPTTAANSDLKPDAVIYTGSNYEANKALRQYRSGGPDALLVSDLDTFLDKKANEVPYKRFLGLLAQAGGVLPWKIPRWMWAAPAAVAVGIFVFVVKGIRR